MAAPAAPPGDNTGLGNEFPIPSDSPLWAPVRALLNQVTLQEWLAQRPPTTVVTAPGSCTCAQALRLLAAHNISSVPVFEGKACIGFVDVGDIVRALLNSVSIRSLNDENKEYRLRAAGVGCCSSLARDRGGPCSLSRVHRQWGAHRLQACSKQRLEADKR